MSSLNLDHHSTIPSNARVVFNLLSLEALLTHVIGATPAGAVQKMTGRHRSTVENWFRTGAIAKIFGALGGALPEAAREAFHRFVTGQIPYPSSVGGLLYAQMGDIWTEYRTSLKQLHNAEILEFSNREHFPFRDEAALIKAVLAAEDVCPPAPDVDGHAGPSTVKAGRIQELESDWEWVVAVTFFHQLAALDIDACMSNFPGRQVRPLIPVIFPHPRPGLTGARYSSPELNLLELAYCAVMEKFGPPTLDDMLECLDPDLETTYRGKHKRGSFRLNDYYVLTRLWWDMRDGEKDAPDASAEDAQRREAFMAVLFFAAKVCSFTFKDAKDSKELDVLARRFLKNYRAAWRFQAGGRKIDLEAGSPWNETHVQKLLAQRVDALEEALAS